MVQMTGIYQGEKHCDVIHGPSGAKISTDAPKDNMGKGEAFSPTDLLGVALGSCMITTMAIIAEKNNMPFKVDGAKYTVTKEMNSNPRRIKILKVTLEMPAGIPEDKREWLIKIANTCPVKWSLSSEVQVIEEYIWA